MLHTQFCRGISHHPYSPCLQGVHPRRLHPLGNIHFCTNAMMQSVFRTSHAIVSISNHTESLKHKTSMSHAEVRRCVGSIMHAFNNENISAIGSARSCLLLLSLTTRPFIQRTHICCSRTARIRPPPSDQTAITGSCHITISTCVITFIRRRNVLQTSLFL